MRALILLCGLVMGFFALLIGQNLGLNLPGRPPLRRSSSAADSADEPVKFASRARLESAVAHEREAIEREMAERKRKSLEPLATLLHEALVQEDWNKVEAVADAIAAHGGDWLAPPPPPPSAPIPAAEPEERTLWELQEELDRRAWDRSAARSRTAASAIARSGDPRARERLMEILKSPGPSEERHDAALHLARSGDEPTIQELTRLLSNDDGVVRAAAGAALAREAYISGLTELDRLVRTSPSPEVRASAVAALSSYRAVRSGEATQAASALVHALREDESEEVRARAVQVIYACDLERCPSTLDALLDAIGKDDSERVRVASIPRHVFEDLAEDIAMRIVRAVERALPQESSTQVAHVFVHALSEAGDRESEVALDRFAATALGASLAGPIATARERIRARSPATPGGPGVPPR